MGTSPLCSSCLILFCISSTSQIYACSCPSDLLPLNLNWIVLQSTGGKKLQDCIAVCIFNVFIYRLAGVGCCVVKYTNILPYLRRRNSKNAITASEFTFS